MSAIKNEPKKSQLPPPTNHMEVEGNLCRLFYEKFGDEALPLIESVFHNWGVILGQSMRAKMPSHSPKAALEFYLKPAMNREPRPIMKELPGNRLMVRVFTCPYRLQGAGEALCHAMMAMDRAMLDTAAGIKLEWKYTKLIAVGDDCCEGIIRY